MAQQQSKRQTRLKAGAAAKEPAANETSELIKALTGGKHTRYSEDEIKAWQKKYPQGIFCMIFDDKREAWFFKPTRRELAFAHAKQSDTNKFDWSQALAEATMFAGDEELLKDDQAMITIDAVLAELNVGLKASILNL